MSIIRTLSTRYERLKAILSPDFFLGGGGGSGVVNVQCQWTLADDLTNEHK